MADDDWSTPNPEAPPYAPYAPYAPPAPGVDPTVPVSPYGDGAYGAPPTGYGANPYGAPPPTYGNGPYGAPQYPNVPYGYGWGYVAPRTEGLAIASLALGIASFGICALCSPAAIVTGVMARRRIRESNGALTGDGLAKAGIIIGSVYLALIVIMIVVFVALAATSPSSPR